MLKAMRKNLKSLAPALWFVIIAFIISIFAVWGGAGRLGEVKKTANTVATIGKERISRDLYIQSLRQRLEMMKREYKELDSNFIQQLNIPQQVLEQIIQQTLLLQIANDMEIDASDEEIREKIMSYPVFQKDEKFIGFEEYKRILAFNRIPLSEFEGSLKKEILIDKVIKVFTAGITVTQDELWENYKNNNETANLEYALLESDKIELKKEPDSQELQEFFEKDKEKYKIPEKREAEYVFIKLDDLKNEIELTDSEIEEYYQDNQSRFTDPEKVKVSRIYLPYENKEKELVLAESQNILDRIHKGEDFGKLAKKYSKDEKSKENGDWGFYDWRRLSSEEQEEINKLSKGKISEVLEQEQGTAILKVTEKEPEVLKPFEEVKERIPTILKDQKSRELTDRKIAQLEKSAQKEKSLDVASQKLGYRIKNTGLLKEREPIEDIDTLGSLSTALFKLEENEISSPIYTYIGVGLAQLKKAEPLRLASFEEVKDEVKEEFIAVKKKELAFKKMEKIRSDLEKMSLEKLAEKYELEYITAEKHKRGQYLSTIEENSEVDRLAFSLPLNEASKPIEYEKGYALIRALVRKEVTREDFDKNKETEKETLLEQKKSKFFQSCLLKMREEKGVKIRYELFLKINSDVISRIAGEE